jgi:hypothetical protein
MVFLPWDYLSEWIVVERSEQVTPEQEQQLQSLDVEIQIAEKQLRIAAIKKQIAETELDVLALHQELQQRMNLDMAVAAA